MLRSVRSSHYNQRHCLHNDIQTVPDDADDDVTAASDLVHSETTKVASESSTVDQHSILASFRHWRQVQQHGSSGSLPRSQVS